MLARAGFVTFKGHPVTLVGNEVKVGEPAPDFVVIANSLSPRSLKDYSGKTLLISVVPSIDTEVCDLQTRRFNEEASKMGNSVRILTISCDLPFAQARWCGANGVSALETLSDHRDLSFGLSYGLDIKELRLLARAILVINKHGILVYQEVVPEITHEPNYKAALEAVRNALSD